MVFLFINSFYSKSFFHGVRGCHRCFIEALLYMHFRCIQASENHFITDSNWLCKDAIFSLTKQELVLNFIPSYQSAKKQQQPQAKAAYQIPTKPLLHQFSFLSDSLGIWQPSKTEKGGGEQLPEHTKCLILTCDLEYSFPLHRLH